MIGGITGLLLCQLAGEMLTRGLGLPVPGPVIGMILLFVALMLRHGGDGEMPPAMGAVADALLSNLGLLFIPAGVGVVIYGPLLARDWLPIAVAVSLGTLIGIAFTGLLAQTLLRRLR